MRFVRCGSKLFRPDAVTAVDLDHIPNQAGPTEVRVVVPGDAMIFRGHQAKAVRAFFLSIPATDLLRRDDGEPAEAVAPNHSAGEC